MPHNFLFGSLSPRKKPSNMGNSQSKTQVRKIENDRISSNLNQI